MLSDKTNKSLTPSEKRNTLLTVATATTGRENPFFTQRRQNAKLGVFLCPQVLRARNCVRTFRFGGLVWAAFGADRPFERFSHPKPVRRPCREKHGQWLFSSIKGINCMNTSFRGYYAQHPSINASHANSFVFLAMEGNA